MRNSLICFAVIVCLCSCDADSTQDANTKDSTIVKDTAGIAYVTQYAKDNAAWFAYNCEEMVAYYENNPTTEFKIPAEIEQDYDLMAFIERLTRNEFTFEFKTGAYNEAAARLFWEQYNKPEAPFTEADILNTTTIILRYSKGTTSGCLVFGKVCPPPAACD